MKRWAVVGIAVLSASAAGAAWTVELSGGERLTVESHWREGDRIHLVKGGVDLIYPASRVVSLHEVADDAADLPAPRRAPVTADTPAARSTAEAPSRDDLEAEKARIEKHLLRVQAERFEAQARGDDTKALKHLDREFHRTQQRRGDVIRDLQTAD
jgi:hypothetical protein